MKCLNCGHTFQKISNNCSQCNIPLTEDQIVREAEIHNISRDSNHCFNCGSKIHQNDTRCQACNYPIDFKQESGDSDKREPGSHNTLNNKLNAVATALFQLKRHPLTLKFDHS